MAPPLLVPTVLLLLPFVPAARSGMIWVTSPPPPASLPPLLSSPSPPAREEHWEPAPLPEPVPLSLPGTPSTAPPGHDLYPSHAGMEKQPIRGLGGLFRRHLLLFLHCVSSNDLIYLLSYKWQKMGSDFTCFGKGGEGVPRGHDSRGR